MINIILKIELMYVEYQFKNAKKIRYTHIFRNGHQSKTVHQRHRNVFQTKTLHITTTLSHVEWILDKHITPC